MAEAGLQNLKEDVKQQYMQRLGEEMEKYIGIETIKALPEKDLDELNTMFGKQDLKPETLMSFFMKKIPNFDKFLAEVLLRFKDQFLQEIKEPKESNQSA